MGSTSVYHRFMMWLTRASGMGYEPPGSLPPINTRYNPFKSLDDQPLDSPIHPTTLNEEMRSQESGTSVISNVSANSNTKKPQIKNLRASDYVTPQKFLDGAEIPVYYGFQSNMIPFEDQKHGMNIFTEVDRRLTLPTRTHIRFLITSTDVIHNWSVWSLHIRVDAMPGRISRMNTFILREGVFYGQCAELCGALHSYMPIVVEAVSPEAYAAHAKKFYKE